MTTQYIPPLHIHFVYRSGNRVSELLVAESVKWFMGDKHSHGVPEARIPVYVWDGQNGEPPNDLEQGKSARCAVVVLIDEQIVASPTWKKWMKRNVHQSSSDDRFFIPCALTKDFANLGTDISKIQAVRLHRDSSAELPCIFLLKLTHHLGRWFLRTPTDCDQRITLFVSHAKRESAGVSGRKLAKQIYDFANKIDAGDVFFDETKISGGEYFDKALDHALQHSAIIILLTDLFSTRYWCAWEAHRAKQEERPMLVIDALRLGETSSLASLGRVRTIRWSVSSKPKRTTTQLLRQTIAGALLEVLRNQHDRARLSAIAKAAAISEPFKCLIRPPEPMFLPQGDVQTLLYPDPPSPQFELDSIQRLAPSLRILSGTQALAALGNSKGERWLGNIRIALSVSGDGQSNGMPAGAIQRILSDLVVHIFQAGGEVAYGGDLRQNGYTLLLDDLAKAAADSERHFPEECIHWYVSWPLKDTLTTSERSQLSPAFCLQVLDAPHPGICAPADSPNLDTHEQRFARVLSTTDMRRAMARDCHARIFVAGQRQGISPWPGLLEEFELGQGKPMFLIGAAEGLTGDLIRAVRARKDTGDLLRGAINGVESDFEKYYQTRFHTVNSARPPGMLANTSGVFNQGYSALSNGLTDDENERLAVSRDITEITALVLRGLWRSRPGGSPGATQ